MYAAQPRHSFVDEALAGCCYDDATGLGDIISTEGDCVEGEGAVAQLQAFYAQAGSPDKYAAAVATLLKSYNDAESSWSRHVPFTPVCGEIKAIGVQAKALMAQIASDTGTTAPAGIEAPKSAATDLTEKVVLGVGVLILVLGGAYILASNRV
jgi:hypothetical protein